PRRPRRARQPLGRAEVPQWGAGVAAAPPPRLGRHPGDPGAAAGGAGALRAALSPRRATARPRQRLPKKFARLHFVLDNRQLLPYYRTKRRDEPAAPRRPPAP